MYVRLYVYTGSLSCSSFISSLFPEPTKHNANTRRALRLGAEAAMKSGYRTAAQRAAMYDGGGDFEAGEEEDRSKLSRISNCVFVSIYMCI